MDASHCICMENSVNTTMGGVGIIIGPRALKSQNIKEKIQPRMMVATFNGNPAQQSSPAVALPMLVKKLTSSPSIMSYPPLVHSIPKHNVHVIGGDMNTQIGKNVNHKFSVHNSPDRNGQLLIDFTLENRLICLITKFQKGEGKLWTYTYTNKHR